ncbi:nucleolar and spindle-associated protein 1 isoform X2 [Anabas testudineus]|uniref:nucleolar and spindle-associated protein 1 isoform X2 n=1 Tax=Anabas testudineus TaxID=64144 RepID=UPI000E456518|nr:nucleolar and spindle-associated protein 1 isoform X2 [Anabas testudineus]
MDLDLKSYVELQSIAKDLGLKANMKAQKLLRAIKQHYQQEKEKEEKDVAAPQEVENAAQDHAQKYKDSTCMEDVSSTTVFVNIRRGKGNGTKRKLSDTATVTECDAKGNAEAIVARSTCGARGAKQRKVSSVCDKTKTEPPKESKADETEPQPDKKAPKVSKGGKIPRYQGQKNKPVLKPVTPNFKKLHEAHFNKMESIDSYVQRKTKQMDAYKNSVKELKSLSDKTKLQKVDVKSEAKANLSRTSMFSPIPVNKRLTSGNKAAVKEDAPFRPSVLSTRRINVRFSEATRDNEYKRSLVKTPARMSPCVTSSTPQKQTTDAAKPNSVKASTLSATKTPGPFIFTGNTSTTVTPGTQKKPNFDLKASLSRPLTYKPHKGKLKPFGEVKENTTTTTTTTGNISTLSNSHQKNYKQHQVKTREDRRAKQAEQRKQKKESMLGARRGLVMM